MYSTAKKITCQAFKDVSSQRIETTRSVFSDDGIKLQAIIRATTEVIDLQLQCKYYQWHYINKINNLNKKNFSKIKLHHLTKWLQVEIQHIKNPTSFGRSWVWNLNLLPSSLRWPLLGKSINHSNNKWYQPYRNSFIKYRWQGRFPTHFMRPT